MELGVAMRRLSSVRRAHRLTLFALAGLTLLLVSCSSISGESRPSPSLPETPFHVVSLNDAQQLIAQTFQCDLVGGVGDIGFDGNDLQDFENKYAQGLVLIAVTENDEYVWVSPDGRKALYGRDTTIPGRAVVGGLLAGCHD